MPTLVTELSPSQRMWLFETFGHHGEKEELQPQVSLANFHDIGDRMSAEEQQLAAYYLPRGNAGQHEVDNRSTIFRRGGGGESGGCGGEGRSPTVATLDPGMRPLPLPPSSWHAERLHQQQENYSYYNDSRGMYEARRGSPYALPPITPLGVEGQQPYTSRRQSPKDDDDDDGETPVFPYQGEKLTWKQSFENLQVYKKVHGDCNVPQKYKHNNKLGGWVVSRFGLFT
jgi:Helicase associated domain